MIYFNSRVLFSTKYIEKMVDKTSGATKNKEKVSKKKRVKIILKGLVNYWTDVETNIFQDGWDSLFGLLALMIFPSLSVLWTILNYQDNFWGYAFPIISICVAGLYDSFGRMRGKMHDNKKLAIRSALNIVAFVITLIVGWFDTACIRYISPILLMISGIIILYDVGVMILTTIENSNWYSNYSIQDGEDDF